MDEKEFKKLASNSRDWMIYDILNRLYDYHFEDLSSEHISGVSIEEQEKQAPKGETSVQETVTGLVTLVTDKAVLIGNADRVAWFPKSVIENLDKIVLEKDKQVELVIKDWFKYKIEWKVPQ